ncbi:MAG TPA: putative zinc-binding protein [Sinorhizobium sp.]|nr:putative zinc-binding protein [Sinorhizobium sp.]
MRSTPDFSLDVDGVTGVCPAGEKWAEQQIAESRIPVLSCEGPCIRGDIARLAANRVAKEEPYARCCHAETFFVPHSAMLRWVKSADKVIVIDGCFLKCHGRALRNIVGEEKLVQFDALPLYKKYSDVFLMDDVPEAERQEVAEQVADKVLTMLAEVAPSSVRAGTR